MPPLVRCALVCLALVAVGCAPRGDGGVLRLYLGRSSPDGPVGDADVQRFLDAEVAPRFADGFTVYAARGAWRAASGAVEREDSVVVEIAYARAGDQRARAEAIARAWKARFHQEAVLLTRSPAEVAFP